MKDIQETKEAGMSQWKAIVGAKCPRCRTGHVFTGATYGFKLQKMNEVCPACGLKFEREPGYFYVAMFVSYAMNVAEMVTVGVAGYVFGLQLEYDNLWNFVLLLFATTLVCSPFNYRYSRIVLLYWLSPGLNYEPGRILHKQ